MPNFNNFTSRAKEAIRKAHEIAIERGQNHVSPTHLLAALVMQEENTVIAILDRLDIDVIALTDLLLEALDGPEMGGAISQSYQLYLTPDLASAIEKSGRIAEGFHDAYVGVEHLFLALLEYPGPAIEALEQSGVNKKQVENALTEIREGGIDDATQPKKYRALGKYSRNLKSLHKKINSTPSLGVMLKSNASYRFSLAERRTTPYSSVKRVSGRLLLQKVSHFQSYRATFQNQ